MRANMTRFLYNQGLIGGDGGGTGAPATHKIVVNGQEREYTLDQLKKAAEKAEGSEERFRLASEASAKAKELEEQASEWKDSHDLLEGLRSKDDTVRARSFIGVSELFGWGREQATQIWSELNGLSQDSSSSGGAVQRKPNENGGSVSKNLREYPEEIQQAVAFMGEMKRAGLTIADLKTASVSAQYGATREARSDIESALDKIPYFRSLFRSKGAEARTKIVDRVYRDLDGRVSSGKGTYEKHLQDAVADAQQQADLLYMGTGAPNEFGLGSAQIGPRTPALHPNQRPTLSKDKLGDKDDFEKYLLDSVNFQSKLEAQRELTGELT